MSFELVELSSTELELQREVRMFLDEELPYGGYEPGLGMISPKDPVFSKKLAERGWLGMTIPVEYGGRGRTSVDRFVVVEELLRRGAPILHHWVADRQTAPVLLKFGTEAQRERFLPGICSGELSFSIGMSEPDAGSDLAAVKTRASKAPGGWLLNGTKIWTTAAHVNDWFVVLCRTNDSAERHAGLSQLIVDLRSPGLAVRPIRFLDGSHDFNEVILDDVFVPDELLLGCEGEGWAQNTSELSYERGGPERLLSTYPLVEEFLRRYGGTQLGNEALAVLGWTAARYWGIRHMALSVARMIDRGMSPAAESAMVKDLATRFEQDVVEAVSSLVDIEPCPEADGLFERLLARAIYTSPVSTIRGGTSEVLLGVATRGLR